MSDDPHTVSSSLEEANLPKKQTMPQQEAPQKKGVLSGLSKLFGRKERVAQPTLTEVQDQDDYPDTPAVEPIEDLDLANSATKNTEVSTDASPPLAASSWWTRLTQGLKKTSSTLTQNLTRVLFQRKLDSETLEELEDALIQADLGLETSAKIISVLKKERFEKEVSVETIKTVLKEEVEKILLPVACPLHISTAHKPFVILTVGVNGSGKTTTLGKLAHKFRQEGHSVLMAAGDTFRAAAIEQLSVWADRTGAKIISRPQGSDAAGLVYDALQTARSEGHDIVLIDTAGRLQNKAHLMAELEKVVRVIKKFDATAPHACLLVLDATVGQNALSQVEIFQKVAGVSGLVMTKLDGTARGGILVALAAKFGIPVHYIGVGENIEDLEPFTAAQFAQAIVLE
jgi:fused signal recognition particle receptor